METPKNYDHVVGTTEVSPLLLSSLQTPTPSSASHDDAERVALKVNLDFAFLLADGATGDLTIAQWLAKTHRLQEIIKVGRLDPFIGWMWDEVTALWTQVEQKYLKYRLSCLVQTLLASIQPHHFSSPEVYEYVKGLARKLEASSRIGQICDQLCPQLLDATFGSQLNSKAMLLPLKGGVVIDLTNTSQPAFRPRQPDDLFSWEFPVAYDPAAPTEPVQRLVSDICLNRPELIDYVQMFLGYCLTGDTSYQQFYLCQGIGANGKSLLFDLMRMLMGPFFITVVWQILVLETGKQLKMILIRH